MDHLELRPSSLPLRQAVKTCEAQLAQSRVVVCMGDRLTLTSFCMASPIQPSLIGAATTEEEGLALVSSTQPDVVIASEDLEKGYGIRLVESIKTTSPNIRLLIFLRRESQEVVQEAIAAGADGVMFVSSLGTGKGDFIQALNTTTHGGVYFPTAVRQVMVSQGKPKPDLIEPLSERELEVVRCITQGMKNSEIAQTMFISGETVKTHVSTAIQKLGVRDRTQAAVFALTHGLIEAEA